MDINSLVICIASIVCLALLLGLILGNISGYLLLKTTSYFSVDFYIKAENTIIIIPYKFMIILLIAEELLTIVLIMVKLSPVVEYNSKVILDNENGEFKKNVPKSTADNIFDAGYFGKMRYAVRNIFFYKNRKIGAVLCIVTGIILTNLLNYQDRLEDYELVDNNYDYEYYVNVKEYFNADRNGKVENIKKMNQEILDACAKYNCMPYYYLSDDDYEYMIDKQLLDEQYLDYLKNDISKRKYISGGSKIQIHIAVMGYSDEMIKELLAENGIEKKTLGNEEALMLSRSVNRDNTGSVPIGSMLYKEFTLNGYKSNAGKLNVSIVGMVKNLSVYPKTEGNYLCIIVNMENFRKHYLSDYAAPFYLKNPSNELILDIERIISGTDYFSLTNQGKEVYNLVRSQRLLKRMYLVILITFFIMISINIIAMMIYEIRIRKNDFMIQNMLGISRSSQIMTVLIENILTYSLGIIMALFVIYLFMDKLAISRLDFRGGVFGGICFIVNSIYIISILMSYSKKQ